MEIKKLGWRMTPGPVQLLRFSGLNPGKPGRIFYLKVYLQHNQSSLGEQQYCNRNWGYHNSTYGLAPMAPMAYKHKLAGLTDTDLKLSFFGDNPLQRNTVETLGVFQGIGSLGGSCLFHQKP